MRLEPEMVTLEIEMTEAIFNSIAGYAEQYDLSVSELILVSLAEYLDEDL